MARQGRRVWAGLGLVRRGPVGNGRRGQFRCVQDRHVPLRKGEVRQARHGSAWFVGARRGLAGTAWRSKACYCEARPGLARQAGSGVFWLVVARSGESWQGRHGAFGNGWAMWGWFGLGRARQARQVSVVLVVARPRLLWKGEARHVEAWPVCWLDERRPQWRHINGRGGRSSQATPRW